MKTDKIYTDRVKQELDIISRANLSGYFLVVQDYCNYAKSQGWLIGPGRGSCAGSLVAYLIGITQINPVLYNLSFARFYNHSRNVPDNITLQNKCPYDGLSVVSVCSPVRMMIDCSGLPW